MTPLYERDTYLTDLPCIINSYIREYDISKANINILLYNNLISEEEYQHLFYLAKKEREITVGKMQLKSKEINEAIKNGFKEARYLLYMNNSLTESNIVSVKKDAVYTLNRDLVYTKFRNIEFKLKNVYTSFYHIDKLEFYFRSGTNEILDIKGMGEESISLHKHYLLDFFSYIFSLAETESLSIVIKELKGFLEAYKTRSLELGYYREFNNRSWFSTMYRTTTLGGYIEDDFDNPRYMNNMSQDVLDKINILYNYSLLSKLLKIYMELYMRL